MLEVRPCMAKGTATVGILLQELCIVSRADIFGGAGCPGVQRVEGAAAGSRRTRKTRDCSM